jgi:SAM-dependent methyltransferase
MLRPMTNDSGRTVADAWRESAPYWEKHGETVRTMFAPLTEALFDDADLAPGGRVLDVAGGPGEPSLSAARIVGPEGRVVHTDVAAGMVAGARREAARRGLLDRVRFAVASGEALPFPERTFDRVVCRLGVMFFPDAGRGLGEMLRVVRPGGRIALVVWGLKALNPYFAAASEAAARYVASPPDAPDAPGAWRFGDPGMLAELLEAAGAVEVRERRVAFDVAAPLDFDAFWAMRVEISDTLREKTALMSAGDRERLREEVREATRAYFSTGTMRFPAEAVVTSGIRHG